jgi:tetratricopeptide (TPR) repeat protein
MVTLDQGDVARAKALLEESLPIVQEVGNAFTLAYVHQHLGRIAEKEGDYQRARALFEEALTITRQVGNKEHIPALQYRLASLSLRRGDLERAAALFRESLLLRRERGDKAGLAASLSGLAAVSCAQGDYQQAARLFGATEALCETLALHRALFDQPDNDNSVASTRAAFGDAAFTAAWAEGRAMTLEQAVEYALAPEGQIDEKTPTVER